MFVFAVLVLGTIAHAVDVEECGAVGESERGSSVLQSSTGAIERKSVSAAQLKHEGQRRETIAHGIAERTQFIIAALVNEGVTEIDAVALAREFASGLEVEMRHAPTVDPNKDMFTLRQEKAAPLHDMLCHVRQAVGDCEAEWRQLIADSLTVFTDVASLGTSFLHLLGVKDAGKKKTLSNLGGGQVDSVLLNGLQLHTRGVLQVLVKSGEDAESARLLALDAAIRLQAMEDHEILEHIGEGNVGLARNFLLSELRTACLPTTTDCADVLVNVIWATDHLPREGMTGSLVQAGVRTFVYGWMKSQSIPDVSEDTAAERALVVGAYVKERNARSV